MFELIYPVGICWEGQSITVCKETSQFQIPKLHCTSALDIFNHMKVASVFLGQPCIVSSVDLSACSSFHDKGSLLQNN